jgi:hypothetical protein
MNRARQGTQLRPLMMDLLERYLSRQDLPVNVRVERLDAHTLLVTHTTGLVVSIRVSDVATAAQVRALIER